MGLLGGTFDPPHVAHLVVAECARVGLELDEVRLLIAGMPWMKDKVAAADHRIAMTCLAVAGDPHLVVDAREADRDGPTYTADTLEALEAEQPGTEWHFILGADAATRLMEWNRVRVALELATFVVVTRPGYDLPELPDDIRVRHLEVPGMEVSSSEIRRRVRAGAATRYLVPPEVHRYISEHGLYGGDHGD